MKILQKLLLSSLLFVPSSCLYAKSILTVGGAQQDVFIRCEKELLSPIFGGQKIEIRNPSDYISFGGGAVNAAISFRRLGYNVSTFFKAGRDVRAELFKKKLDAEGISTNSIIYSNEEGTGVSYIIPSSDHDNGILVYRGANKFITKEEVPTEEIKKSNILYITSLNGASMDILLPLVSIAKEHNKIIALNPGGVQIKTGNDDFYNVLCNTSILILNTLEAKLLMNFLVERDSEFKKIIESTVKVPKDLAVPMLMHNTLSIQDLSFTLHQFFKIVLGLGPKIVVVTNGADGVYVGANKSIYYHPSIPTMVVSTTGAGDAFGSCFVGMLLKNYDSIDQAIEADAISDSMYYGALNSASVISYMDTNKGLLNEEELMIKAKQQDLKSTQTFSLDF